MNSEESRPPRRPHVAHWARDITPVLKGWDYEPGTINVRKVNGADGHPKLQMRLDLGLLQMELTGRPDGRRPHGFESLLDYHEMQLAEHRSQNGDEEGFHLNSDQCQALREEAVMYYHRYLSLFVLGDFPGVIRDTERNIRLLDICGKFALEEQDQLVLEQYRPYIIMMRTRAAASIQFRKRRHAEALRILMDGIGEIRQFFKRFGQPRAYKRANEVRVLRRFARDIRKRLPVDPIKKLNAQLQRAIADERYEEAARLRDEIEAKRSV